MYRYSFILYVLLLWGSAANAQQDNGVKVESDSVKAMKLYLLSRDHTYNNPKLGKHYAREAIAMAIKAKNRSLEAAGYNNLGLCHRNLSEYDSAITVLTTSSKIFLEYKDLTGYGNAINNIAITHFYIGEYEKANTMLLEVIKDAEELKLYPVLSNAYQNLGIINNSQERFGAALDNFILAEKFHLLYNNQRGAAGAAINQASMYFKLKQYQKAIAIYKKTIPIKEKTKDEKGVGIIYNNMAEIYLTTKEYPKALENINKAIPIRLKVNDQYGLAISYFILADIYFNTKKYPEAEKYAAKAVNVAKSIGAKKELSDALKLLSKIKGVSNDLTGAYDDLVNAVKIKDSLLNKENFAKMAELETKYQTEKNEREILIQRTKIAENQLKIDQKNMVILGTFTLVIITISIGYMFYNKQKLKTIKLEKEAELKDALLFIETQNKLQEQRLTISRDLHDNIGSQLTFIISSLDNLKYSYEIANEGLKNKITGIRNFTKETITELRDTIWAMNKEEITLLDLSTRISNFIENAKAASKGIHFVFEIEGSIPDSVSFSSLKGINLYRVIQESIHNALKHGNATEISVTISGSGKGYSIKIKDNGSGFDPANANLGNGLANIKKRVIDSGGTLAVLSSPGSGTEIIISIK